MAVERLSTLLAPLPGAIVAYSGGADSAFLADVAHEVLGERMLAVTAVSASLHPEERGAASRLAAERGWRHEEIFTDEVSKPEYARNSPDRCFHCKDTLFDALDALAAERGAVVLVGTNLDDTGDFRPGQRAAREHGVRAPLLEAQLTKAQIRALSRERGLPTWDKLAQACLSSRIAYGVEVTPERLGRIARAETLLRELGITGDIRVRDLGEIARIELSDVASLTDSAAMMEAVSGSLRAEGFAEVIIDPKGFRSGSMNEGLIQIRGRS